jgi:hypothetical protein
LKAAAQIIVIIVVVDLTAYISFLSLVTLAGICP